MRNVYFAIINPFYRFNKLKIVRASELASQSANERFLNFVGINCAMCACFFSYFMPYVRLNNGITLSCHIATVANCHVQKRKRNPKGKIIGRDVRSLLIMHRFVHYFLFIHFLPSANSNSVCYIACSRRAFWYSHRQVNWRSDLCLRIILKVSILIECKPINVNIVSFSKDFKFTDQFVGFGQWRYLWRWWFWVIGESWKYTRFKLFRSVWNDGIYGARKIRSNGIVSVRRICVDLKIWLLNCVISVIFCAKKKTEEFHWHTNDCLAFQRKSPIKFHLVRIRLISAITTLSESVNPMIRQIRNSFRFCFVSEQRLDISEQFQNVTHAHFGQQRIAEWKNISFFAESKNSLVEQMRHRKYSKMDSTSTRLCAKHSTAVADGKSWNVVTSEWRIVARK